MDARKMHEVAADLRAEGRELLRLADELEAKAKRDANGSGGFQPSVGTSPMAKRGNARPRVKVSRKGAPQEGSYLTVAVEVLRQQGRAMHIRDLVPMVEAKRGKPTTRGSVESALVRGIKSARLKNVLRRTGPGMFEVVH